MSDKQIAQEAERAADLVLAGLPLVTPVDHFVRERVRQAYLLGRAEQAAKNFDDLIASFKQTADENDCARREREASMVERVDTFTSVGVPIKSCAQIQIERGEKEAA